MGESTSQCVIRTTGIGSGPKSTFRTFGNLLWSQKGANRDEPSRVVQAGYDFIMKRTRLSKKTVQRITDKLTDKDFIAIEVPAD